MHWMRRPPRLRVLCATTDQTAGERGIAGHPSVGLSGVVWTGKPGSDDAEPGRIEGAAIATQHVGKLCLGGTRTSAVATGSQPSAKSPRRSIDCNDR